jgi:hypothetical protein
MGSQPESSDGQYARDISREALGEILSSTVKHDDAAKQITFLAMLLAQTEEDQPNVAFQGESSLGKSYIPLEVAGYFPESERKEYAGASPTSFYHDVGDLTPVSQLGEELRGVLDAGELASKRKVIVVDLEGKILIFIDQPSWQLMAKLRPLESHDKKYLRYSITDKTGKAGLRAKTVIIKGYPSIFFCTASRPEQQEKTRTFMLFPQGTQEKLRESLKFLARKLSNREEYRKWLTEHLQRRWLIKRVQLIRESGISNVVIKNWEEVYNRYVEQRPVLSPRAQRDLPRLMCLIKGFAILNCFTRAREGEHAIIANEDDVKNGFALYDEVATFNELGISYEEWAVYQALLSLPETGTKGVTLKDIVVSYRAHCGRSIRYKELTKNVLPNLEGTGLVELFPNPANLLEPMVRCLHTSASEGVQRQETADVDRQVQTGVDRINEEKKAQRSPTLSGLVNVVGEPVVEIMKERRIIWVLNPATGPSVVILSEKHH